MHKGRRDENAGAEVTGEEEKVMRNRKAGKAAHYDRKRACCDSVRQWRVLSDVEGGEGLSHPRCLRLGSE